MAARVRRPPGKSVGETANSTVGRQARDGSATVVGLECCALSMTCASSMTRRSALHTLFALACIATGCGWEWEPVQWNVPNARAPKAVRTPAPIEPVEDGNLLQHYAGRPVLDDLEPRTWGLPTQAQRLAVALLIVVAKDRLDDLRLVLTADAEWGYPDRRRFAAKPVFGDDGGEAFMQALRVAAERLPAKSRWKTAPMTNGLIPFVRSGAEPMWISVGTGADALIMRERVVDGVARIDYIGFFVEPPSEPIHVYGRPAIPPLVAPPRRAPKAMPLEADEVVETELDSDADELVRP